MTPSTTPLPSEVRNSRLKADLIQPNASETVTCSLGEVLSEKYRILCNVPTDSDFFRSTLLEVMRHQRLALSYERFCTFEILEKMRDFGASNQQIDAATPEIEDTFRKHLYSAFVRRIAEEAQDLKDIYDVVINIVDAGLNNQRQAPRFIPTTLRRELADLFYGHISRLGTPSFTPTDFTGSRNNSTFAKSPELHIQPRGTQIIPGTSQQLLQTGYEKVSESAGASSWSGNVDKDSHGSKVNLSQLLPGLSPVRVEPLQLKNTGATLYNEAISKDIPSPFSDKSMLFVSSPKKHKIPRIEITRADAGKENKSVEQADLCLPLNDIFDDIAEHTVTMVSNQATGLASSSPQSEASVDVFKINGNAKPSRDPVARSAIAQQATKSDRPPNSTSTTPIVDALFGTNYIGPEDQTLVYEVLVDIIKKYAKNKNKRLLTSVICSNGNYMDYSLDGSKDRGLQEYLRRVFRNHSKLTERPVALKTLREDIENMLYPLIFVNRRIFADIAPSATKAHSERTDKTDTYKKHSAADKDSAADLLRTKKRKLDPIVEVRNTSCDDEHKDHVPNFDHFPRRDAAKEYKRILNAGITCYSWYHLGCKLKDCPYDHVTTEWLEGKSGKPPKPISSYYEDRRGYHSKRRWEVKG